LRDDVTELHTLPKWAQEERMLKIFTPFGVQFHQKTGSIELSVTLDFLDGPDLVVETGWVIATRESFGFKLLFES
jgi:hypothetical protein